MNPTYKSYRIRKFHNGKNKDGDPFINYSLTIPAQIAEALPREQKFVCELTDEGILFRPAEAESNDPITLPAWAKEAATKEARGNGAPASRPAPARSK